MHLVRSKKTHAQAESVCKPEGSYFFFLFFFVLFGLWSRPLLDVIDLRCQSRDFVGRILDSSRASNKLTM